MATRVADRLNAARRRHFVGRTSELERFRAALTAPELPYCVLHAFGPGGVGKTTLLARFAETCRQQHVPAICLDARNVEPSPTAFLGALAAAMGLPQHESPLDVLAGSQGRQVILIDTYETLAPLDDWLRETFLPQLPEDTLVVLASRLPPSAGWRADPGWHTLVRPLPLRNLSPDESRDYLTRRGVPQLEHDGVLEFTHGHPLALSLVADVFAQRPNSRFRPQAAPDVVKTLLEQFVQKVPGPAHRAALEACALVRVTTEPLLAEMLRLPDAHELFEWLRGLSFIELGPHGLCPHDLAREALVADLHWRNPDWYAVLHSRAREVYSRRLQHSHGLQQQSTLIDYIYLHRDNPVVRPFFVQLQAEWQESGGLVADSLGPQDRDAILEMVERHEGKKSASLAERWMALQPEGVQVYRDATRRAAGFLMVVSLHAATVEEREADPATAAAWRHLERHTPLRPGEGATLFRFWMGAESYQSVSPAQSLAFVQMVRHYLTSPGLAFTFLPCAVPDFWLPVFSYADLQRIPEADFEVDGVRYGVYGHDWRSVPPVAWLDLLAQREVAMEPPAATKPRTMPPLIVLSQPDFVAAVHRVLANLTRADALLASPLLRSRFVVTRVGTAASDTERVSALQGLIREAVDGLQASPRDAKAYRALYHTYVRPAATQEQAAELLDLPFSTYRRHLKVGITRVAEILWQQELQGLAA